MASERQLKANRKNAMAGGVKTAEGKAVVSQNAIKHGLTSGMVVLPSENREEFIGLCNRLNAELNPVGELERFWVDRIAKLMWRLRRCDQAEMGLMFRRLLNQKRNDADHISNQCVAGNLTLGFRKRESEIIDQERYSAALRQIDQIERLQDRPELLAANLLRSEHELLNRFGDYETGIQKRLTRSIHELESLQERRRILKRQAEIQNAQVVMES